MEMKVDCKAESGKGVALVQIAEIIARYQLNFDDLKKIFKQAAHDEFRKSNQYVCQAEFHKERAMMFKNILNTNMCSPAEKGEDKFWFGDHGKINN